MRAVAGTDHVAVEVADDGPGIPETIREQVFDPFVRGDTPGATGLGLAVARAVVSAHGGSIDPDTGTHGTRLRLVLPWSGSPEHWMAGDGWHETPGWDPVPTRGSLAAEVAALAREATPTAPSADEPAHPTASQRPTGGG